MSISVCFNRYFVDECFLSEVEVDVLCLSLMAGAYFSHVSREDLWGCSAARYLWSRLKYCFSDYKLIPVTFCKDPKGFGVYVALILSHYFMF